MTVDYNKLTDNELIERYRSSGNELAWEALQKRYYKKIYYYSNRRLIPSGFNIQDVEDVVEEVFVKVFLSIDSFEIGRRFSAWLYTITRNLCYDRIKKPRPIEVSLNESLQSENAISLHDILEDEGTNIEVEYSEKEIYDILYDCLDEIEEGYKEMILLFFVENLTFKEISDILQINPRTVPERLARAIQLLKRCIRFKTRFEF